MLTRLFCIAISIALALAKLTAIARAETASYDRVLSAVTLHFEPQAGEDRALLIADEKNKADLYIFRGVDTARSPMTPSLIKKDVVWNGPKLSGQRPSLAVNQNGALLIHSGESFNNRREDQSLTIMYRDKDYYVVGVTLAAEGQYDNEYQKNSCDINLLTGKGRANEKSVRVKPQPVKLSEWSEEALPDDCAF